MIFTRLTDLALVEFAAANAQLGNRVAIVSATLRHAAWLKSRSSSELVQAFGQGSTPCGQGFDVILVSENFEPDEWFDAAMRTRLMPARRMIAGPSGVLG